MGKTLAIALISSMILVILGGMTSLASSSDDLTDQQKQLEIQRMVDNHRSALPTELVLAIIRQEGGEGAFHIDGWDYNNFYNQNDGPWAQPTNGDGIMQVTTASGHHEKSGSYTHDQSGYDHAINDGCNYLLELYGTYETYVQTTLHYNTGPNTLYIYLGRDWGDRNYLSNVATHLSSFVPNTYGLQNQNLVESLNQGQSILDDYLYNRGIETGRSLDYYSQYQVQLDNDLNNILNSDSSNLQTDLITLTLYVHEVSASGPVIPGAVVTGNDGSGNSFMETTDSSGYVTITGDPGIWSFSVSADKYETNSWDQEITETDTKDAYLQKSSEQFAVSNPPTNPSEMWNSTFGHGSLNSVIYGDNGYVAAGHTYSLHDSKGGVEDCSEAGDWRCDEDALLINVDYNGNEMWRNVFGGDKPDVAFSVIPTTDGGYIIEGTTYSYNLHEQNGEAWLLKTDSTGNEMWNRTFIGTNYNRFSSVQPTPDGGCVIAAQGDNIVDLRFYSYKWPIEDDDAWLIKIDSAGDVVWDKAFDIFNMNGNENVNSMLLTSDGGCILAGRTGFADWYIDWIMKTDSEGNEIWNKTFSETEFISEEQQVNHHGITYYRSSGWAQVGSGFRFKAYEGRKMIHSLLPIDGGYILAGEKDVDGAWDEAWLTKVDTDGNEIWSKTIPCLPSEDITALDRFQNHNVYFNPWIDQIQPTQDGGYILSGQTKYHTGYSTPVFDAWLTKVDSEGNQIWSKNFGIAGILTGQIQPTQDGGYIFESGAYRIGMMKFDSEGNEIWNRPYDFGKVNSILPTMDGGCIIAGAHSGEACLIKIEADGLTNTAHQKSQSTIKENLPIGDQNTPTSDKASEETPTNAEETATNAEESPLPISVGALSLITANLFLKLRRNRL